MERLCVAEGLFPIKTKGEVISMARPLKTGLDYFLSDVNCWDDGKIMDLTNTYGPLGMCVYDIVLRQVYKNGYYLKTSLDSLAALIIRTIGNAWVRDKGLVKQILTYCGEIGLLDAGLLSQSVVTSVGIQRRYAQVTARNRVDRSQYWLLPKEEPASTMPSADTAVASADRAVSSYEAAPADCMPVTAQESVTLRHDNDPSAGLSDCQKTASATITPVSAAKTPVIVPQNPQRREEERRVEESREEESRPEERKKDQTTFPQGSVCSGFEIPCRNGAFVVDEAFYTELTHMYPDMEISLSLKHLVTWLLSNPEKQRFRKATKGMVLWWVQGDNDHGRYRIRKGYEAGYDIDEYESTSVLDEYEPDGALDETNTSDLSCPSGDMPGTETQYEWQDSSWLFDEMADDDDS